MKPLYTVAQIRSIEAAAAVLGLSRATAYRHWSYARAGLLDALREPGPA